MVDLTFSKITKDDLEFLNNVRNEFSIEFLHDSRIFTLEETLSWFLNNKPDYWIIKHNKIKIGYFRLSLYSIQNKNIYIGADLHPEFHGKGLAYSSYILFISFLFKKYKLNKISLEVLSTNLRAIKLYKKIGFVEEGIKRQEVKKGKLFIDSIIMSILKNEWKACTRNEN